MPACVVPVGSVALQSTASPDAVKEVLVATRVQWVPLLQH